jgi:hypothetical protein
MVVELSGALVLSLTLLCSPEGVTTRTWSVPACTSALIASLTMQPAADNEVPEGSAD